MKTTPEWIKKQLDDAEALLNKASVNQRVVLARLLAIGIHRGEESAISALTDALDQARRTNYAAIVDEYSNQGIHP